MISRRKRESTDGVVYVQSQPVASDITVRSDATTHDMAVFGPTIMDDAVKEPTLDRFLDGNPKVLNTDNDYIQLAEILRKKRAMDITKETKRKEKKDGIEDEEAA